MKAVRTLVVVADGANARFFLNAGPGKGLEALEKLQMSTDLPRSRDIMADRPGRAFSSVGTGRSAMEPKSDPRNLVERDFVKSVAGQVEKLVARGDAERVVLVAAPRTLGELRKLLPSAVEKCVIATIDKDLTKATETDLPKHLEKVLAV